ncbi:hypothetical protein SEVIR_5G297300v4 [Setaria viridis]
MVSAAPSSPASRTARSSTAGSSARITRLCLLILLLNCCGAIYHSRHDPGSVAFVAASFTDLALLLYLLPRFEGSPLGSRARSRAKAGVWILSSILTVMFSCKVGALMPLAAAIAVWTMGMATVLGGFFMLFLCGEAEQVNSDDEPLKAAEDGANKQHEQPPKAALDGANKQHGRGDPDLHQPILSC